MSHLNTKSCCGHTFTAQDIKSPLMSQKEALGTNDPHLYGGNAQRFAYTQCPECEKEYILWLKRQAPSYKVLTISHKNGEDADNDEADFDKMNAKQLRKYLNDKGVSFFKGAKEEELRELAKETER